jgi:hypothetical protein
MKKYFFLLFILIACNPTQKVKNNLEKLSKFVSGVESGCISFSDKNWAEADSTFNDFKTYFNDEHLSLLSPEERDQYNILNGKYSGMKAVFTTKKAINDIQEGLKDLGNKAKGFIEGVSNSLESDTIVK